MNNHKVSVGELDADDLTWREQEILILLGERLTNREIANQLHLAESTVKDYVGKILSKLFVKNRRQAVERAKTLGLLQLDRGSMIKTPSNLPAESTQFVGRMDQLIEIEQCLAITRLLTLVGPGGTGKTRLALKAAEAASRNFKDGCFLVSLAQIRSVDDIVQTIAEVLKFPIATHEDPQNQLIRYLRKRHILLVLDNFEHLLEGSDIVNVILQAAPGVKILVTSRERLNLHSETILSVGGMLYPEPGSKQDPLSYDAVALFMQRARQVLRHFNPSPSQFQHIVSICQFVQGMPLAIELAAAWLYLLKVEEIAGELEKGFDILSASRRDTPRRHHSIRAVFEHSWSLLLPAEQEILTRLSVFRGGFTRQAALQVAGASLQALAGLVNKSFLSHNPASGRLEIHELLRQYAQEQLDQSASCCKKAHEAHAAYFATFMEQGWERLRDHRQMAALADIEADIENIRAAWKFCVEHLNTQQMWQFIYGLWFVYWVRWWNHAGVALFAQAATVLRGSQDEDAMALWALTMAFQGYFMGWLDLSKQGYELAKESASILESLDFPQALIFTYDSLSVNAYFQNRYIEEFVAIEKMVKISMKIGDRWLLAFSLFAASMNALLQEDYQEANRLAHRNLKLYEEIGDRIGSSMPLIVLGHVALARNDHENACGFYLRCLQIAQQTGFHYGIQTASKYLGKVTIALGRFSEANKYLVQSLTITQDIGFIRDILNLLVDFAHLKMAQGDLETAAELLALIIENPASQESRLFEGKIRDSARDLLNSIEAELPPEIFSTATGRGKDLALEPVITALVS